MTALELDQYLQKLRWGETQDTIALLNNNEHMTGVVLSKEVSHTPDAPFDVPLDEEIIADTGPIQIRHHGRFTGTPRHTHDVFEMMYVRSGSVTHIMDDGPLVLNEGSFLMMAPGVYHSTQACGLTDIAVNFLLDPNQLYGPFIANLADNPLFTDFLLQGNAYDSSHGYFVADCSGSDKVHSAVTLLLQEYFDPAICSDDNVKALFPVLLNSIYRCWLKTHDDQLPEHREPGTTVIRQALQYISVHHATVSLKELSDRFGYAPKYFGRLLIKHTGQSFTELKQQAALRQACVLLSHSDQPIASIAQTVGFSSTSFFYSVFRRYFDMSPAEYRKKNYVPINIIQIEEN